MNAYRVLASLALLVTFVVLAEWGGEFGLTSGSGLVATYLVVVVVVLLGFFLVNSVKGYRQT
ncbi:hypothetical protein [Halorussus sp. AFM4]|uniref:hypothetical protein n=1 Tax=Halorussus sp. AFM4 TaxID=3421651 RepID=UPI003EBBC802